MKASVIITNYNFSKYITDAITSVINQTYDNIELIIIDDGSTDNSQEIIQEYKFNPNIKIILKNNGGQLSCLNHAVKLITGDIVFLLDSDDSFFSNYIEQTIDFYKNNPSYDIVSCQHLDTDAYGKVLTNENRGNIFHGFTLLATYYLQDYIGNITSTISIKSSMFKKLLPMEIESDWSSSSIDTLLHYSVALAGGKAYYSNQYFVYRKIHGENLTIKWKSGEALTLSYRHKRHFQIIRLFHFVINKYTGDIKNLDYLISREYLSRNPKNLRLILKYLHILFLMNQSIIFKISMIIMTLKVYFKDKQN